MNPIIKIASEQIAEGNTVISIFSDSSSAGIIVRLKDDTEVPYEIKGSDPSENKNWLQRPWSGCPRHINVRFSAGY